MHASDFYDYDLFLKFLLVFTVDFYVLQNIRPKIYVSISESGFHCTLYINYWTNVMQNIKINRKHKQKP